MIVDAGPITRLAALTRSGSVSSVELVTACLDRIAANDPAIGAVVALRADDALKEAAVLDDMVRSGDIRPSALHGLPLIVKDLEDVAGMPTRKGSLLLADAPPALADGHAPARLRAAGAIVVGKSALPEFAIEGYTSNLLTGSTRNPWDVRLSPGGSSGGSAAVLSAGIAPIATATDGGGSIRIPAAFCGLVGLKPTRGVVARPIPPDWIDLSTDGPLATSVADLRLLLDVLRGYEVGDPEAAPVAPDRAHPSLPGRVLVAPRTSDLGPLPADVAASFESATAAFAELVGSAVVHVEPGGLFTAGDPDLDWFTLAAADHVSAFGRRWVEEHLDQMHLSSQEFFAAGLAVGIDEYLAVRRRRFEYVRVIDELLGADAVLLTPTVAVSSVLADGRLREDSTVGALPPEVYSTALANMTGSPAISLPAGSCGPLPFGLQILAPRFTDGWLLDLGEAWERAYPWQRTAPGYDPFDS